MYPNNILSFIETGAINLLKDLFSNKIYFCIQTYIVSHVAGESIFIQPHQ